MRNRKNDIERYLRGELSAAEMHALEKEALNDPFLAEALEGIDHAGADNFLFDLHKLNKSVHRRTRTRKNKTVKMWGWTVGIAASVLLIAVSGFLVISLLKNQKSSELAMKEEPSAAPEAPSQSDTIASVLDGDAQTAAAEKQESPEKARQEPFPGPVKPSEPVTPGNAREEKEAVSEKDQLLPNEQSVSKSERSGEEGGDKKIASTDAPAAPTVKEEDDAVEKALAKKLEGRAAGVETKKRAAAASQIISGDSILLTGNVVSAEDGTALPGVSVMIKGTNIGTVTDVLGNYQLAVQADKAKLVFSFIGFESREVDVGNKRQVNVQLPGDAAQLSEVVVSGYGYATDDSRTDAASFRFAEPEGGRTSFKNYLSKELKYPAEALKNKAEGKVTIRFTVDPDGQLKNFQVIKGIGYGCEEELIRLIKEGPAWKPSTEDNRALQDQVKVRFKFELPKK